ncbi:hypothetical protein CCACVL1_21086 [Corchorus capsularis]|uniref:Uncharacterized protein n=1 Tax=Corchorus capsularis TaxID=210143 RepID=A0A1R3H8G4_COCAP|nr:hypothetical protein CCACVL1_21086 [Corchorus capsularis]
MASYTKSTNQINIRQAKIPSQRMQGLKRKDTPTPEQKQGAFRC